MDFPVTVIINNASGGMADAGSRQEFTRLIKGVHEEAEIIFAEKGMDTAQLARQAIERGSHMIVAGGGDGTISSIASVLAGKGTILGVLPLGTFNHFAKDLGIPMELEGAVHTLATGSITEVDAGQVNGRIFINNSSMGLYASFVRHRENKQEQGQSKRRAAFPAAIKSLAEYRLFTIKVTVAGQQIVRETPIVFVGNNQYTMTGMEMGTRSRLDSGELSLVIPHSKGRLRLFWFSLRSLLGREYRSSDLDIILAKDFSIESGHHRLQIILDGEVQSMSMPLHYQILPKALRVIAPLPVQ